MSTEEPEQELREFATTELAHPSEADRLEDDPSPPPPPSSPYIKCSIGEPRNIVHDPNSVVIEYKGGFGYSVFKTPNNTDDELAFVVPVLDPQPCSMSARDAYDIFRDIMKSLGLRHVLVLPGDIRLSHTIRCKPQTMAIRAATQIHAALQTARRKKKTIGRLWYDWTIREQLEVHVKYVEDLLTGDVIEGASVFMRGPVQIVPTTSVFMELIMEVRALPNVQIIAFDRGNYHLNPVTRSPCTQDIKLPLVHMKMSAEYQAFVDMYKFVSLKKGSLMNVDCYQSESGFELRIHTTAEQLASNPRLWLGKFWMHFVSFFDRFVRQFKFSNELGFEVVHSSCEWCSSKTQ